MKKVALTAVSTIAYLFFGKVVFALTPTPGQIQITKPDVGYSDISTFLNAGLRLAFIIAIIAVLIMLVWGAVEWIFSGGNKEAYGKARDRILHALIGLAILAIAFAIVTFFGSFVGINPLGVLVIPNPSNPVPSLPTNP